MNNNEQDIIATLVDDDRILFTAIREEVEEQEGMAWELIIAPHRFRATLDIRRRAEAVYRALAKVSHPAVLAGLFNRNRCTLINDERAHDWMMSDRGYSAQYTELLKGVVNRLKITLSINQNNLTPMFTSTISGNLGRDAEVKTINGKDYYKFNLGVASTRKDAPTTWVSVLYYKSSDKLAGLLVSGTGVLVQGRQETKVYKDRNGEARVDISIWADTLEITRKVEKSAQEAVPAGDDLPEDEDIF